METGYKVKAVKQISMRIHPDTGALAVYHLCELLEENQTQPPSVPYEIEEIKWIKKRRNKKLFHYRYRSSSTKTFRNLAR